VEDTEKLIVFEVNGEEYSLPIHPVKEVLESPHITPVPESLPFILGIMNLRGKIVPVIDLARRLDLPEQDGSREQHILITEGEEKSLVGVKVGRVMEILTVHKDEIQPTPAIVSKALAREFLQGAVAIEQPQGGSRIVLVLELIKVIDTGQPAGLNQSTNEGV